MVSPISFTRSSAVPSPTPRLRAAMSEEHALGKRPRSEGDSSRLLEDDPGAESPSSFAAAKEDDGDSAMAAADAGDAADEDFVADGDDADDEVSDDVDDEEEGDELLRIDSKQEWDDAKASLTAHIKNTDLRARRFEVAKEYDGEVYITPQVVCCFSLSDAGFLLCEEEGCGRRAASKATSTTSFHHCVLHIENYHEPAKRRTTTGKANAAGSKNQKRLASFFQAAPKRSKGQFAVSCNDVPFLQLVLVSRFCVNSHR